MAVGSGNTPELGRASCLGQSRRCWTPIGQSVVRSWNGDGCEISEHSGNGGGAVLATIKNVLEPGWVRAWSRTGTEIAGGLRWHKNREGAVLGTAGMGLEPG